MLITANRSQKKTPTLPDTTFPRREFNFRENALPLEAIYCQTLRGISSFRSGAINKSNENFSAPACHRISDTVLVHTWRNLQLGLSFEARKMSEA